MKKVFTYLALVIPLAMSQVSYSFANENPAGKETLKEAWNNINDPFVVNPNFNVYFQDLPRSGEVNVAPWSDSYWPTYQGGIAYRWNSTKEEERLPFDRAVLSGARVKSMSQKELETLSPAEKYDIFMGNFDFPTLQHEMERTSSTAEKWEGLCHGWAAATTNYVKEPAPIVLTGPGKVAVPFGASDIKALLTFYQGEVGNSRSILLGSRCEGGLLWHAGRYFRSAACRDVSAGSFHVVLANMIGKQGKAFVADMTTGKEVWNFPVYAYNARIVKVKNGRSFWAAKGTVKEVEFQTDIYYSVEADTDWAKIGNEYQKKTLNYRVEINARGEIIGGEWEKFDRPDFLWVQERPETVQGSYYGQIESIYQNSLK